MAKSQQRLSQPQASDYRFTVDYRFTNAAP
jgi:hypothetical protein